jgi:aspartate aminotransferase
MTSPHPLSVWARNVSPSPTLAIDAKAKAMLAAGEDVCSFAAGEPDFDTPQFIKDAAIAALQGGKTKYAPTPGIEPLRQAIADRYAAEYGYKIAPSQVVVSPGGKYSCYLAILATCNPGDEVVIPAPYWVSYPEMVKLAGATPRFVLCDDQAGFKLTPALLKAALTPKTKLLVLNSPSNPTGAIYSRAELAALAEICVQHNLYVLADEMYEHLMYDGNAPVNFAMLGAEVEKRTITVAGFSKSYSMTGWRLGTLVAPAPIAKACAELQSQMSSNATTFAQYGALAALKEKRHLPPRRRRVLSFPQHLQLRAQGRGVLRQAPGTGKGGGGAGLGLRRRGLPAPQLRHVRRDHPQGGRAAGALLRRAEEVRQGGESHCRREGNGAERSPRPTVLTGSTRAGAGRAGRARPRGSPRR